MYIFKKISTSELILNSNKREDDIHQFIPQQFDTTKEDMEFYLLPDSICRQNCITGVVGKPIELNGEVFLEEYESLVEDPDNEGQPLWQNLLATHPTQLIAWPYDEEGNFVEPEEFIPQP